MYMDDTGLCKHQLVPEWCSECKHLNEKDMKQLALEQNLQIVENLLSWENESRTI